MVRRITGDFGGINALLSGIVKAVKSQENNIATVVLKDIEGRMKQRIFNNGLDSNMDKIGQYSTKDMLVGASSFDRIKMKPNSSDIFGTKRKRAKFEWVTLKGNRRLAVLKGGYAKFRRLFKRKTDKVDLEFTSDLRNSIQVGTNGGQPVLGFLSDFEKLKADGNEKRFTTTIFTISSKEDKALDKALDREITRIIQRVNNRV